MAKVYLEDTTLTTIGNAIREKTGKTGLLLPSEMPFAIKSIQSGGDNTGGTGAWQRPSDWWDTETILVNAEVKDGLYPAYILLLDDADVQTTFSKLTTNKALRGDGYLTSDGKWHKIVDDYSSPIHTWDITKDKECSLGYKTRWVLVYVSNPNSIGVINLANFPCLEFVAGDITISDNGLMFSLPTYNENNVNETIESVVLSENTIKSVISNDRAFYACNSLRNVSMPNLTKISSAYVFGSCGRLNSVNLPNLERIEKDSDATFSFCRSLTDLHLPKLTYTYNTTMLIACSNLRSFDIPATYVSPNGTVMNMFNNCFNLRNLNLYNNFKIKGLNLSACRLYKSSILDILSKLGTVSGSGYTLTLGAINLIKLTSEEIAIGTGKGWTIN